MEPSKRPWPLGDKTMKLHIRNTHTLSPSAIVGPLTGVLACSVTRILPMLSAALCLLFAPGAFAANWYVDNAITASGNGTSWATAWKRFSNIAWSSIRPGDTLYISGGGSGKTYTGGMRVYSSGRLIPFAPGTRDVVTGGP